MATEKIRKKKNIQKYEVGDEIDDLFAVRFKKPVRITSKGSYWFELKLQDAEGEIMLKYWGDQNKAEAESLYNSIAEESVVRVKGKVGSYNEKLEFSVNKGQGFLKPLADDEFFLEDFIRKSKKNADEMLKELKGIINALQSANIRQAVDAFFSDKQFLEEFRDCPAAMYKHHGWMHGLLEHTLSVAKICADLCRYHPALDRDLVLAGALLHDIGKIGEFATTTMIKVTDAGNLLGHITIGVQMLTRRLDGLNIPEDLKQKLLHILISHHNHLDFGSPKKPAFPEALVVARADDIDAQVTMMIDVKETAQTEDSFIYTKDFGNVYLR